MIDAGFILEIDDIELVNDTGKPQYFPVVSQGSSFLSRLEEVA